MKNIPVQAFFDLANKGLDIIDLRESDNFGMAFIKGSINIPYNKKFADRVKQFFSAEQNLLLVMNEGDDENVAKEFESLGYKHVIGYLEGGFISWTKANLPVDMIIDIEADELMMDLPYDENLVVIDVRKPLEFAQGHLKQSVNIPLNDLADPAKVAAIEERDNVYLHCGGGSSSFVAASYLKKQGVHNLHVIIGGWRKIKEESKAKIVKEPDVLN
ncbi:MAG: rhodanese-like domain-containing protein [Sphingobacteriales bacterium]|jgi:rhodanese-related sulfurtransferase|nr:rhodanese-like domain-containing protein [Sphingobacteriales bacterium]